MRETSAPGINRDFTKAVAFMVGAQQFCVDIMSVREIRGWTPTTAMPHAPSFMRGVINLRGTVLPVVDLAEQLGFTTSEPTPRHVIIVAELPGQVVGFLVEAVSDIIDIVPETVQPTPDVASSMVRDLVGGIIAAQSGMISVLRTEKLAPRDLLELAA